MNELFNTETRIHRKTEHIFEQFKHTIGPNVHLLVKRDFKRLKLNGDEVFRSISFTVDPG